MTIITTVHILCDDHSIGINAYGVWEKGLGFMFLRGNFTYIGKISILHIKKKVIIITITKE